MFHHVVEIQYKRGDRSAMHRRMKNFCRAVEKTQSGAVSCTYGPNLAEKYSSPHLGKGIAKGFTHVFVGVFKTRKDYDIYMRSAIHVALGPHFEKAGKDYMICDYVTR